MAPIDLCLPLLKYSYADSDTTSSNIDWTHFSAVNLCALVQGDDISNGRLTLSIVDKTTHKVLMIVTVPDLPDIADGGPRRQSISHAMSKWPMMCVPVPAREALLFRQSICQSSASRRRLC